MQTDLQRATGLADTDLGQASHLHRVLQLTGGLSTGVERGKTAQLTQRPPWVGCKALGRVAASTGGSAGQALPAWCAAADRKAFQVHFRQLHEMNGFAVCVVGVPGGKKQRSTALHAAELGRACSSMSWCCRQARQQGSTVGVGVSSPSHISCSKQELTGPVWSLLRFCICTACRGSQVGCTAYSSCDGTAVNSRGWRADPLQCSRLLSLYKPNAGIGLVHGEASNMRHFP